MSCRDTVFRASFRDKITTLPSLPTSLSFLSKNFLTFVGLNRKELVQNVLSKVYRKYLRSGTDKALRNNTSSTGGPLSGGSLFGGLCYASNSTLPHLGSLCAASRCHS